MPLETRAYAALAARGPLEPWSFPRRDPGPRDVLIDIAYCGVCHSDIHQVRDEWGGATFPMVPGHEIVGHVAAIGSKVERFRVGEAVGVGCMVGSCRTCPECQRGEEQYCEGHVAWTYNGLEQDRKTPTYGGYCTRIVVDERFVLRVPDVLPIESAAPLLCAGITTWSPMRRFGVERGHRLAVVGLGGLGHMAVKFGVALGAEVTVLSMSAAKEADAQRLGATGFVNTSLVGLAKLANRFDFVIDTVSAAHDYNACLGMLRTDGTMILVGVPEEPTPLEAFSVISRRRRLVGSLIGGIHETQQMLDFCGLEGVTSDVQVIAANDINHAYEYVTMGDVRYRFVIDTLTI